MGGHLSPGTLLVASAAFVAVVAAVRSTWSPCGLSMLATITPLAERGRGHRYRSTAAWFVLGSVAGGVSLGGAMAVLAAGVHSLRLPATAAVLVAVAATALVVVSDAGVAGPWSLPVHHRQVNERWLDQFRPWVYGAGFGWQIGCGLATYVMTGAVYLVVVLGALGGRPVAAMATGVTFGLVRGLAVLLGRRITTPEALRAFHRRFFGSGPLVAAVTVVVEVVVLVIVGSSALSRLGSGDPLGVCAVAVLVLGTAAAAAPSVVTSRARTRAPAGQPIDRVTTGRPERGAAPTGPAERGAAPTGRGEGRAPAGQPAHDRVPVGRSRGSATTAPAGLSSVDRLGAGAGRWGTG